MATAIPFNEQVAIFRREVSKVFDYVAMDDFYRAKFAIHNGDWSPENIAEVLMRANYNGAIMRITYYKFVHKLGFDVRALWDALILEWQFSGVWDYQIGEWLTQPEFKRALKKVSISGMGADGNEWWQYYEVAPAGRQICGRNGGTIRQGGKSMSKQKRYFNELKALINAESRYTI